MVKSWAVLTAFSHVGERLASTMRLLYFFSKRSCCWWVSCLKLGGHTFRALYGLFAIVKGALFRRVSFDEAAMRLSVVENMAIELLATPAAQWHKLESTLGDGVAIRCSEK